MRRWDELNKKQKKHIREMSDVACEREMAAALDKLYAAFLEWKQGKITPFALDEKIHQYHNSAARELYKQYSTGNPDMAVLFALKKGVLKIGELNEDCRSFYRERLDRIRD